MAKPSDLIPELQGRFPIRVELKNLTVDDFKRILIEPDNALIKQYQENPSDELFKRIQKVMHETEDEHDAAGNLLKELRKITNDFIMPNDGCRTYFVTYKKLEELESDLFQHIHLENNILFRPFE